MKCSDDQLFECSSQCPTRSLSTEDTSGKECEPNKVAYKAFWKMHPSATNKAMSHQSALPKLYCPVWAVLLFCLTYAAASVALHPSRWPLSDVPSAWPTSLEPLLALNSSSSIHRNKQDLHIILTPLTDDRPEIVALNNNNNSRPHQQKKRQLELNRKKRSKREMFRRQTLSTQESTMNESSSERTK